jgi:hypothetical protein
MASSEKSTALALQVQIPEGMQRLGSVRAEAWFSLEENNVLEGKLLGCFSRDDKRAPSGKSEFFQVETTKTTKARYGKGEKAKVKDAPAGTILNLNCNHKSQELKTLLPDLRHGAEYQIFVHCGKKIELNNGNTMWDITTASKMTKAPQASEDDFDGSADDAS